MKLRKRGMGETSKQAVLVRAAVLKALGTLQPQHCNGGRCTGSPFEQCTRSVERRYASALSSSPPPFLHHTSLSELDYSSGRDDNTLEAMMGSLSESVVEAGFYPGPLWKNMHHCVLVTPDDLQYMQVAQTFPQKCSM